MIVQEGTIAALRRSYLDATSVEERESLMREISQANAQKRLSMPAHGYRLHRPRPKPALRDSEKLDYESSGLVHREVCANAMVDQELGDLSYDIAVS